MLNNVKPFSDPAKRANNAFVDSHSRWWAFGFGFVKSWLVMDLCYLFYFLANTTSVLLGWVTGRGNFYKYVIKTTQIVTAIVTHCIVLIRLRSFEELFSQLVAGRLNLWEDRGALKKRSYRCFFGLIFAVSFLLSLNLAEALISFRVVNFLYQLVDIVTFGNADRLGEYNSRLVLLTDNFFYTALNSSMIAMWLLLVLFSLTLSSAISCFKDKVDRVPFLTQDVIKKLHEAFHVVQRSIQTVDRLFSPLLFLWYFDALVSAFHGIVYFMEGSLGDFSPVYAAFNFFMTSVAVLGLTYVASMIPNKVQDARSSLMDKARESSFDYPHLEFFLFYKRLGVHQNGLTAGGFFLINRNVCLSFVGFLVTYLVVLYSSGNRNTSG